MPNNNPLHVMCPIFGLALLLTDAIHWSQSFAAVFSSQNSSSSEADGSKNQPTDANGKCQSPIDISPEHVTVVKPSEALNWTSYDVPPDFWQLTNNGQSAVLTGKWAPGARPYLEGGALTPQARYNFHNVSFRWGPSDEEGSEHTFNNTRYALELQMMHVKDEFSTVKAAYSSRSDDAIVMVAYLFEIIPVDNPFLDPITNNLMKVVPPGSTVNIPPFPLSWFYDPFPNCYYTYKGSLTHPPCSEVVTWILLNETLPVSPRQVREYSCTGLLMGNSFRSPTILDSDAYIATVMFPIFKFQTSYRGENQTIVELFRQLHSATGQMFNVSRPVQPRNNRRVYLYA